MRADVFCNNNPPVRSTDPGCLRRTGQSRLRRLRDELLRCYAVVNGNILRVGLPAPEHGRLRLRRHLSRQMLHETGCEGNPSGSISHLRRSLCRRAMRRPSRRLSPEIRSWTRF